MTPAGTSNELDVQNGWEENTHTHTGGLVPTLYCRPNVATYRRTRLNAMKRFRFFLCFSGKLLKRIQLSYHPRLLLEIYVYHVIFSCLVVCTEWFEANVSKYFVLLCSCASVLHILVAFLKAAPLLRHTVDPSLISGNVEKSYIR